MCTKDCSFNTCSIKKSIEICFSLLSSVLETQCVLYTPGASPFGFAACQCRTWLVVNLHVSADLTVSKKPTRGSWVEKRPPCWISQSCGCHYVFLSFQDALALGPLTHVLAAIVSCGLKDWTLTQVSWHGANSPLCFVSSCSSLCLSLPHNSKLQWARIQGIQPKQETGFLIVDSEA